MEMNTQNLAQIIGQTDTSEMDGKYLTFWTDKQLFGVPIAFVVQIVGMQTVTEVPEFPHYAKGIIDLRGTIVPLIDARLRLGKVEAGYDERTCIIVTSIDGKSAGLIVDEVDAVTDIAHGQIASPPQLSGAGDRYITGVGRIEGKVVLLMDLRKILGGDELDLPEISA